jgi:hypothetical protein
MTVATLDSQQSLELAMHKAVRPPRGRAADWLVFLLLLALSAGVVSLGLHWLGILGTPSLSRTENAMILNRINADLAPDCAKIRNLGNVIRSGDAYTFKVPIRRLDGRPAGTVEGTYKFWKANGQPQRKVDVQYNYD